MLTTRRDLIRFHTRNKLLLLAHSPSIYSELGRLVSNIQDRDFDSALATYSRRFAEAMTVSVSRGRHANVLRHMAGYLRSVLPGAARQEITQAIDDYQKGLIPLSIPAELIAQRVAEQRIDYLREQVYLQRVIDLWP